MLRVLSAVATDPGLRRDSNEDSTASGPFDLGLYLVAGRHVWPRRRGSRICGWRSRSIEAFINDTRDADVNRTWPFPYDTNALSLDGNRIKAAFRLANRRVATAIEGDDALRGMATTAVAVLVGTGTPVVAHVGDSRAHMLRDGQLKQSTKIIPGSASRFARAC